ncbi:MAG: peptide chain release factor N(5)-glutamine methyltransferase [Anaerolineae bacterium]|nr:peptide chain release factor N(5)-glutamine methyltransferase [Anaerolineae bacterium]
MTTVREALHAAVARLDAARIDAPATTARLLLAETLGVGTAWLVAHNDQRLTTEQQAAFEQRLRRVVAHEPLAYVLGRRAFFGLDLYVDPRVLIPRQETELLVELALTHLRSFPAAQTSFACVDVGTGSGAVAIAVAAHAPAAQVLATDISLAALRVAQLNARRCGVADRVSFLQADLLSGLATLPPVIVANLPYVSRAEIEALPPEIRAHEPRVALDGGADGLAVVRRLLDQIAEYLARGRGESWRAAFLEISAAQGEAALKAAHAALPEVDAAILKDLAKLDRVLALWRT